MNTRLTAANRPKRGAVCGVREGDSAMAQGADMSETTTELTFEEAQAQMRDAYKADAFLPSRSRWEDEAFLNSYAPCGTCSDGSPLYGRDVSIRIYGSGTTSGERVQRTAARLLAALNGGWVPVGVRLPALHVQVLVFSRDTWGRENFQTVAWRVCDTPENYPYPERGDFWEEPSGIEIWGVTHWRELHAPPASDATGGEQ